jgi:hypothetical protein
MGSERAGYFFRGYVNVKGTWFSLIVKVERGTAVVVTFLGNRCRYCCGNDVAGAATSWF